MKSTLSLLAAVGLAAAQTTLVPDEPITFFASLYTESSNCSGGKVKAFLADPGSCVNIAVPANGSAMMRVADVSHDFLGAWSGPDCTGTVVMVASSLNTCEDFGDSGVAIQSWSNDQRIFG
ncbi:hypothetical protein F4778DRAFT_781297 [Xylariomycetidae sp. FL2044]|nr:hypothetical protein F4778DRAFT_781297 [Xylariomycetidae sp. FL2044]